MRFAEAFDAWVQRGPFQPVDLARFRIIFGVGALLTMWDFSWWGGYPASMFSPPPGPFQLFSGFPPYWVGIAIELGVALSLACVAFGYRTRIACWAASILMMLGFGFTYSFDKIDHSILFVIAPALLSFTGWGDELSVDKLRGARPSGFRQWPVRLFAVMIGLAFFTAGLTKIRGSWLSPATQAVRRELLNSYIDGNRDAFTSWLITIHAPLLWEAVDWLTVLLELGLIVCALTWSTFRIGLAVATIFHLGVLVMLAISFGFNVLAYGAFVEWGRVPVHAPPRLAAFTRRWWMLLLPVVALVTWAASHAFPHTALQSGYFIVVGAGVSAGYLLYRVIRVRVSSVRHPSAQP